MQKDDARTELLQTSLPCTYLYMNECNEKRSPHTRMHCSGTRWNMHDFAPRLHPNASRQAKCRPPPPPQERRPAIHTAIACEPACQALLLLLLQAWEITSVCSVHTYPSCSQRPPPSSLLSLPTLFRSLTAPRKICACPGRTAALIKAQGVGGGGGGCSISPSGLHEWTARLLLACSCHWRASTSFLLQ